MSQETRDELFGNLERNWQKTVARQGSEKIEVPEFADEAGNAAIWYIKRPAAWTVGSFEQFDKGTHQIFYAAGTIVASAHDMFGNPIFFDNNDESGADIPLQTRLQQMDASRDKLVTLLDSNDIIDLFLRVAEAVHKLSADVPTPEEVKEPSNPESTG